MITHKDDDTHTQTKKENFICHDCLLLFGMVIASGGCFYHFGRSGDCFAIIIVSSTFASFGIVEGSIL